MSSSSADRVHDLRRAVPAGAVQVGDGGRAHVFRSPAHANAKRFELRDGGTVYDIVLCGARGPLSAADDISLCASCSAALERG